MKTALERMLKFSVRLNGLLIPVAVVESTLARYTEPIIVWNHDDVYSCSLMGSGVAIHYRNQYLLLCTRHQLQNVLDGRPSEDVGLLDKDGVSFCSSAGIRYFDDTANDVELHDLVVFDFTAPCKDRPVMRERFYNLQGCPPTTLSNHIVAFIASGYPSKNQKYDFTEEEKKLGFVKATVPCLLADYADQFKNDHTLLRLKPLNPLIFDPDGISGGSAFVIQLVEGNPYAYLGDYQPG